MAILRSNGVLIVDSIPVHTPADSEARFAFDPATLTLYGYDGAWSVLNVDIGSDVDFSAKSSFKLPTSAAPTVNANGEIALDTSVSDISHGVVKIFGGEELALIAVPIAELSGLADGDVIKYNATADEFQIGPVPTSSGGRKAFLANYTQATTGAPALAGSAATNDFGGTFTPSRDSAGVYTFTLVGAFPDADKFFPTVFIVQTTAKPLMYSIRRISADAFTLETYTHDGTALDVDGRFTIGFEQLA